MLSPQRERFAQEITSGKSQSESYRIAYPKSTKWKPEIVQQKASRLMADGKVQARVEELRRPILEKVGLTLEDHLTKLADLRDKAEKDGKYAAAISAETNRGRAAGLYKDRLEVSTTSYVQTVPESENMEDWAARCRK
jgi:phage terminase small subunit